jgi:type VI secretion system protein ImpM
LAQHRCDLRDDGEARSPGTAPRAQPPDSWPVRVGVFGKLPARGDFVRLGLPGGFVAAWDAWLQRVLPASRTLMEADWLPAWLEAPVWRFALAPGTCGPEAVLGLWLPSVDRVGRYFPLTLAAVFPSRMTLPPAQAATAWLEAAEAAGRAALETEAGPEAVVQQLPRLGHASPTEALGGFDPRKTGGVWWTEGGPRVARVRLCIDGLPDAARFAAMLGHASPCPGTGSATAREDRA